MKSTVLSLVLVAATGANAFVPASQAGVARGPSTSLAATADSSTNSLDRRTFTAGLGAFVAGTAVATSAMPVPAYAKDYNADYTPRFDDLKQIYVLGVTLDRLIEKIENAEKYNEGRENRILYDKALEGLRQWNKDPNFYTGYAKNYISKSVKKGAVDDPRVAYIKDASDLISGCQELLEERVEGFTGKAAGEEGIKRVKEAQKLVGKFLAESGVEGEDADKIAAYVKAH